MFQSPAFPYVVWKWQAMIQAKYCLLAIKILDTYMIVLFQDHKKQFHWSYCSNQYWHLTETVQYS